MNTHLPNELQALDATTGGVFSAPTSGERASRVRAWLATAPEAELMQAVYKELSARDKGAAKALREKLDELKRERHQDELIQEWAQKGEQLRQSNKMSLAQALAWQRDAAKAGVEADAVVVHLEARGGAVTDVEDDFALFHVLHRHGGRGVAQ